MRIFNGKIEREVLLYDFVSFILLCLLLMIGFFWTIFFYELPKPLPSSQTFEIPTGAVIRINNDSSRQINIISYELETENE